MTKTIYFHASCHIQDNRNNEQAQISMIEFQNISFSTKFNVLSVCIDGDGDWLIDLMMMMKSLDKNRMSLNLLTYCLYCMYHFRCSLAYNGSSLIARGKKSYLLIHLIALYEMRMSEHKWCYLHQRAHNEKMAQFQNTKHYKTAKKINDFNFSVFFSLANCSVHSHREKIVEQFLLLFLFG